MSAQATDGIQNIDNKADRHPKLLGALAHTYLVNHSKTNDIGHISPSLAQAENDDSDGDKDYDAGKIETGASGGEYALQDFAKASS